MDELVITNTGDELLKSECKYSEAMGEWISNEDALPIYGDDFVTEKQRDDYYYFCKDTGEYHHSDESWYCNVSETVFSDNEDCVESYCGVTGHEDSFCDDSNWTWISVGLASESWLNIEHAVYCTDIEDQVHEDDAYWNESNGEYYYDEDNIHNDEEVVNSYHSSSNFIENLNCGKSPFSIGFEVEKNEFDTEYGTATEEGDHVGSYNLFAGFETDSSCGVEAVTHILPLSPIGSEHRDFVFKFMDEAEDILNSPSDTSCGGHITVSVSSSVANKDAYDIANDLKSKIALLYALYRYRLKRTYCSNNKHIKKEDNTKYSPVNIKSGDKIEFRIPSRVRNVNQLKLRYDLMYSMLHYTYIEELGFSDYLEQVKPIILQMYSGDNDKVDEVYSYAEDFRKYLSTEEVSTKIEQFICA